MGTKAQKWEAETEEDVSEARSTEEKESLGPRSSQLHFRGKRVVSTATEAWGSQEQTREAGKLMEHVRAMRSVQPKQCVCVRVCARARVCVCAHACACVCTRRCSPTSRCVHTRGHQAVLADGTRTVMGAAELRPSLKGLPQRAVWKKLLRRLVGKKPSDTD